MEYQIAGVTLDSPPPILVPASLPLLLSGLGVLALGCRGAACRTG